MNELEASIYTEKWRPSKIEDLVFEHKESLINYLKKPLELPSFIFYSVSPGTGKSSLAKIISNYLKCDMLLLNSSLDRGIDVIRDKIGIFAQGLSSNPFSKRLIFLDEADGVTSVAFNSLRNFVEEYSQNVFFIFSCNDLSKIIAPIQSRCILYSFDSPPKKEIMNRLINICQAEEIEHDPEDISKLINLHYPDIRSMILTLQSTKIDNLPLLVEEVDFQKYFQSVLTQDIQTIYAKAYSSNFNILGFNRWLFKHLFENFSQYGLDKASLASLYLAETEKNWNTGANLPIIFIANMLQISKILNPKK